MTTNATLPAWQQLAHHAQALSTLDVRTAFRDDPQRFAALSFAHGELLLDVSKQRLLPDTLRQLLALARAADLPAWIERLVSGEPINASEGRAALHTALRDFSGRALAVAGRDVMPEVRRTREAMRSLATALRTGEWRGGTGERIRSVVNIGIGGSDLGPRLACAALAAWHHPQLAVRFVANVDPGDLGAALVGLDPASTLFIVASKTFTTQETMSNALRARAWLRQGLPAGADLSRHLVAVSANVAEAARFGIPASQVLPMWDWVGGRYSVWSAVGTALAIAVGWENFEAFLHGGEDMDRHFASAPLEANLPVLLGLVGVWNRNLLGLPQLVIVPYAQGLAELPAHLQQLEMESNGKRTTREGGPVERPTCPAVWGGPGSNVQHAFFQWLHQGTDPTPVDFIVAARSAWDEETEQAKLLANALAQSQALMLGRSADQAFEALTALGVPRETAVRLAPQKAFPGNRPSTTLVLPRVDPFALGQLIALYEHKVFVQGVLWGVNSFDQWGVELGKELAGRLLPLVEAGTGDPSLDPSTSGLLAHLRALREDA